MLQREIHDFFLLSILPISCNIIQFFLSFPGQTVLQLVKIRYADGSPNIEKPVNEGSSGKTSTSVFAFSKLFRNVLVI